MDVFAIFLTCTQRVLHCIYRGEKYKRDAVMLQILARIYVKVSLFRI